MQSITSVDELRDLYDEAVPGAIKKVARELTPLYRQWIDASRFCIVATAGPAGTDASPRGDAGAITRIVDAHTLWLPDWRGNNRLDTLENIVTDGRISLLYLVPHSNNVVRVNGSAVLTASPEVVASFNQQGKTPKTVIVIRVGEVYFQCAKALMRSALWSASEPVPELPSAGAFLQEVEQSFDAQSYDDGYADYAKDRMW